MARKENTLRPRLTAAATRLRHMGDADGAQAIEEILAPNGWGKLRRTDEASSDGPPSMSMRLNRRVRDHVRAAAEEAGESMAGVVEDGFRAFLTGRYVSDPEDCKPGGPMLLARPARQARGTADSVLLTLRPDEELRKQVEERCADPAVQAELGFKPYVSTVAVAALLHRFPLPERPAAR